MADVLPSLRDTVWVGLSAGSLVAAHPDMPGFALADAERWGAALDVPGYAIDDQTAITVLDGEVAVVSEGHWTLFD